MTYVSASAIMAAEKVLTEDNVKPGIIGGVVFFALFIATYFLWRSMNKQLKRVDENFPEGPEPGVSIPERREPDAAAPERPEPGAPDRT
jgi:hypothetical protein